MPKLPKVPGSFGNNFKKILLNNLNKQLLPSEPGTVGNKGEIYGKNNGKS